MSYFEIIQGTDVIIHRSMINRQMESIHPLSDNAFPTCLLTELVGNGSGKLVGQLDVRRRGRFGRSEESENRLVERAEDRSDGDYTGVSING